MKIKLKLSCLNTVELLIEIVEFRKFLRIFTLKTKLYEMKYSLNAKN
jgi:hypothetical protein